MGLPERDQASPSIMFAPLHPVCTRFSGKVQTRMRAMGVRIEVLERYVQRYVLIRIVVCTICTGNGEPPRGGNPGRVPVKTAVVQTSR